MPAGPMSGGGSESGPNDCGSSTEEQEHEERGEEREGGGGGGERRHRPTLTLTLASAGIGSATREDKVAVWRYTTHLFKGGAVASCGPLCQAHS